jgi:hypothetical protein
MQEYDASEKCRRAHQRRQRASAWKEKFKKKYPGMQVAADVIVREELPKNVDEKEALDWELRKCLRKARSETS